MKKLLFVTLLLLMPVISFAEIPISNLPAYVGSQVGTNDVIPFVHFASPNVTGQLPLSNLFLIPSLQSPTFTGTLTVPTVVFTSLTAVTGAFSGAVSAPSGTFTTGVRMGVATIGTTPVMHNLNTVSAAFANCGSLSGATGCIKINLNGATRYIPYY